MTAFLLNSNIPLGSESNDGLRIGPMISGTQSTDSQLSVVTYDCWGNGLLLAPINCYNITPRGPSTFGNVVAAVRGLAGNLNLATDNYVTTLLMGNNGNYYVQLDWPRALSVNVLTQNFPAGTTITVFGLDVYGVPMQESVTVQFTGIYSMKKAFYVVISVYCGAAQTAGGTVSLQTTDVFGLPYSITSAGNILGINWGNDSDIGTSAAPVSNAPSFGVATLVAGTVTVNNTRCAPTSVILLSLQTAGGTLGSLTVVPGAEVFTITSSSNLDTSKISWNILTPTFGAGISSITSTIGNTVQVASTAVASDSVIFATPNTLPDNALPAGTYSSGFITSGSFFTITATGGQNNSTFNWYIAASNVTQGISGPLVNVGTTASVTVTAPDVLSNSIILVNYKSVSGTAGILSVPSASIVPGKTFNIVSSSNVDTSTCYWAIVQNVLNYGTSTPLTGGYANYMGTARLVAGTVTVSLPGIVAGQPVIVTYNTLAGTQGVNLRAVTTNNNITITSSSNLDTSTVNWAVYPLNYEEPIFTKPLGTFTPADLTTPSNTTGDVRGTYLPSTPANGFNELQFNYIVSGFDNFQNQQASVNLPAGGTPTIPLTQTEITVTEQYGLTQYYTGEPG